MVFGLMDAALMGKDANLAIKKCIGKILPVY
jgi:hypothetical protein